MSTDMLSRRRALLLSLGGALGLSLPTALIAEEAEAQATETPAAGTAPATGTPGTVLSRELGFGRTKSVGLGSSSGRRRCLPILERFASEGAERVAGNKMPLNVERVMDDGVNG
jgi:hypothetical protein